MRNEEKTFFFFFTFQNYWNLFCVYQNGFFLPGKAFHAGEKNQEKSLCPSEKFSSYAPAVALSAIIIQNDAIIIDYCQITTQ